MRRSITSLIFVLLCSASLAFGVIIVRHIPSAAAPVGPWFLRPDSDIANVPALTWMGQDSGTNLYTYIDEATTNDADYVWTDNAADAEYFTVGVSDPSGSPTGGVHTLRVRLSRLAGARTIYIAQELYEDGTRLIATNSGICNGTAWTTYSHTLTAGEVSSTTNYNNLSMKFLTYGQAGGGGKPDPAVSYAVFEVQ
jgi:hypothetical protein